MKHLVLLGAGHAHVHVLTRLAKAARKAPLPFRVTLVAPYPQQIYSGMLPGYVAGRYTLEQCTIPLGELIRAAGVEYVQGRGTRVDVDARLIGVAGGQTGDLGYDILSVNTGPVMDRERIEQSIPGARANALFLRPIEAFFPLWERLEKVATRQNLRVAVVGGGAAGLELAFALRQRLPHCSLTLVCGSSAPAGNYPEGVQRRVAQLLKTRGITVLPQTCTAIAIDHIRLNHVTVLPCDVAVLALGAQAPAWLAASKLALDEQGFIAVNRYQQSTSDPLVFAAGDVASRVDAPHGKSGVHAVRAAPALAANLIAAISGLPLQPYQPPRATLNLLSCGAGYAVASRGQWSTQGRWVWHLKDWIDRRFMAKLART